MTGDTRCSATWGMETLIRLGVPHAAQISASWGLDRGERSRDGEAATTTTTSLSVPIAQKVVTSVVTSAFCSVFSPWPVSPVCRARPRR